MTIENVAESDFGDWTCKAMVWDEWGEGKVILELKFERFFN